MKWVRFSFLMVLFIFTLLGVGGGYVFFLLQQGPLSLEKLRPSLISALNQRLGREDMHIQIEGVLLAHTPEGVTLRLVNFSLLNQENQPLIAAPEARISLEVLPLMLGIVHPTQLEVLDLDTRLFLQPNGSLSLLAGSAPIPLRMLKSAQSPASPQIEDLATTIKFVLDLLTREDAPLASLGEVRLRNGKLKLENEILNTDMSFQNVSITFRRQSRSTEFYMSALGSKGMWYASLLTSSDADHARTLTLRLQNLSIEELRFFSQRKDLGFQLDAPLLLALRFELTPTDVLKRALFDFKIGEGVLSLSDPDFTPTPIQDFSGQMTYDAAIKAFKLESLQLLTGDTRLYLQGLLIPPLTKEAPWRLEAHILPHTFIEALRPNMPPVSITKGDIILSYLHGTHQLNIPYLSLFGKDVDLKLSGDLGWDPQEHVNVRLDAGRMPSDMLLRLWPMHISPHIRSWLVSHLVDGILEKGELTAHLTREDLEALRAHRAGEETHLNILFSLSKAKLFFLMGLPPLVGLDLKGHMTGRQIKITGGPSSLDVSGNKKLSIPEMSFEVPDTDPIIVTGIIKSHIIGALDHMADLLGREALKPFINLPLDPSGSKGQVEARLEVQMPLSRDVKPQEVQLQTHVHITNFGMEHFLGKERFDQGDLTVSYTGGILKGKGQGNLFGTPTTLDFVRPAEGATQAVISFSMEEAVRNRLGLSFAPYITGPLGVKITTFLPHADKTPSDVEVDFTPALVSDPFFGFTKAQGKAGRLKFTYQPEVQGTLLDHMMFESGGASAQGSILLDPNNMPKLIKFSSLRPLGTDDMKVEVEQTPTEWKINMRGSRWDARPLLRQFFGGDKKASQELDASKKGIDFQAKFGAILGYNDQTLKDADLHLRLKDFLPNFVSIRGFLGKDLLEAKTNSEGNSSPIMTLTTPKAGALFSFLDIYRKMEGGTLSLMLAPRNNMLLGQVSISDFALKNEPAFQRFATEAHEKADNVNVSLVSFRKLKANFQYANDRLDIQDAAMFGPRMGLTLHGSIYLGTNNLNIGGTYVPAYGLNNLVSRIPVFGMILGGGQNEGLFGVNFKVTGSWNAPHLTINPLSALTPGFLRKIFGGLDGTGAPSSPTFEIPQER